MGAGSCRTTRSSSSSPPAAPRVTRRPQVRPGTRTGRAIYNNKATAPALGGAKYDGRVGEAAFGSTASTSKMMDIFAMSSYDLVATGWTGSACGTAQILGADG